MFVCVQLLKTGSAPHRKSRIPVSSQRPEAIFLTGKVYNSLFQVTIIPHICFMQKSLLEATISSLKIFEFPVTHLSLFQTSCYCRAELN